MKKKSIVLFLCFVFVFSFSTSALAINEGNIAPVLLSSKTVSIDNVLVEVKMYTDNGAVVTTASLIDEREKSSLNLDNLVETVEMEKMSELKRLYSAGVDVPFVRNFSNYAVSEANSDCNVGHSGKWYGTYSGLRHFAKVDSLQIGAVYSGPGNANKIKFTQYITCTGFGISIDSSGSFNFFGNSNSTSWSSSEYENTSYVSIDLSGYVQVAGSISAEITVRSVSEIQVNNSRGYTSEVSDTYGHL